MLGLSFGVLSTPLSFVLGLSFVGLSVGVLSTPPSLVLGLSIGVLSTPLSFMLGLFFVGLSIGVLSTPPSHSQQFEVPSAAIGGRLVVALLYRLCRHLRQFGGAKRRHLRLPSCGPFVRSSVDVRLTS